MVERLESEQELNLSWLAADAALMVKEMMMSGFSFSYRPEKYSILTIRHPDLPECFIFIKDFIDDCQVELYTKYASMVEARRYATAQEALEYVIEWWRAQTS